MDKVILRIAVEEDLDWLLDVENDASHWAVGDRTHMYTRDELADFLSQNHSFLPDGNLRWIICTEVGEEALGVLDIFAYDTEMEVASVGILITESVHRRRGFGLNALELLESQAFGEWGLKGLHALVQADNIASQGLFTKAGYAFKYKQDKGLLLFQKDRQ